MKKLFIAANWKSNKSKQEARDWLIKYQEKASRTDNTIVLCVPFTLFDIFHNQITLGAQDVSPHEQGAYTGEIAASQLKEYVDWVIIGHSERRKYFLEDDKMLTEKVKRAKEAGLSVIFCVSDEKMPIPQGVDVVAYEPTWAIGTGKSDTPENANAVCTIIKKTFSGRIIYGGSVTAENVKSFVTQDAIDGVLPGGASLDPQKFTSLIANASV